MSKKTVPKHDSKVQHKKRAVASPFEQTKNVVLNHKVPTNPAHKEDFERLLNDAVGKPGKRG